jgi:putative ABC transport system ATP-binding protein
VGVRIENLVKRYIGPDGSVVPVIDIRHFDIADGEQVAMIGTSGSGKTTLLHMIAGILTPDEGSIWFGGGATGAAPIGPDAGDRSKATAAPRALEYRSPGRDEPTELVEIGGLSEAERDVFRGRHIGYIFQTHHLLPGFTALENVLLGMSFTGRAADPQWARHLLKEVGLSERLDYKPAKLSVGQQQRVAVARALANRPQLVLADEPTGALDVNNSQQVLDLIRKLCAEINASLLLVSHDLNIARQLPRVVSLPELNHVATKKLATEFSK